ncbi:hypothetical protein N7535_005242 [Penicillium sp. DV-2018c]|nr:hypothetical protein N7461_008821 [Penicillium sp. DV-2018c]KAJ5571582.1 hypothetical protein N7535_005242 [Penicillium sp. DV-2018c]
MAALSSSVSSSSSSSSSSSTLPSSHSSSFSSSTGSSPSFPPFSKGDLRVLAGEFRSGKILKWDDMSLFANFFAEGIDPEMFVLFWELGELHANLIVVVAPGSQNAWILRVVLAPEFLWLGLHRAGLEHPVPITTYSCNLSSLFSSRPLVASMVSHYNMGVSDKWGSLINPLRAYLPAMAASAGAANTTIVPAMRDCSSMEVEVFTSADEYSVEMDVCDNEYPTVMDVCEEHGASVVSVAASPSPSCVRTTVRESSAEMDVCEESGAGVPVPSTEPVTSTFATASTALTASAASPSSPVPWRENAPSPSPEL